MSGSLLDTLRFVRGWLRPPSRLRSRELHIEPFEGSDPPSPATLLEPSSDEPAPTWVVLHGLTRRGRHHPSLVRFTRALTSTGGRVLVPEVEEWMRLEFAPRRAQAVIRGAVDRLHRDPATAPGGVGLVGFSFGAPQALLAAADPGFASRIRCVVGWGGYADLHRTVSFHFTGRHEWEGRVHELKPDPYGRWVVGANCLTLVPAFRDAAPVARALRALAAEAGDRGVPAWDPVYDPLRRHLRRDIPRRHRALFDLFAPPRGEEPEEAAARPLVDLMVPAAKRQMPLLDPLRAIEGLRVPVRLLHARADHLIPFTETLELARSLQHRAPDLKTHLTGLFEHSTLGGGGHPLRKLEDAVEFARALRSVLEAGRDSRSPATRR